MGFILSTFVEFFSVVPSDPQKEEEELEYTLGY